ncbi:class I adenylate-forming enzyme family protein [Paenactinomyces guangxiensis]|uniref:Long-chain-fatty-acid--CoA ligase n=1 Tax=Paenactinomyces guangxiensis TaxID=1490290 RepID=A0A7W1WPI7_9BACL|nr:long-chain-fatty-acid--CoA ligase [Paenactinomyces guangxiensis]MBA4493544.1 long-chain-fatty-acid--CoA ligase [Paenactinomyces guangxiensis]MBH8590635.1 long-chain-fatty-acid--CoA ligase [Paenactinomyces guangxiensis]
MKTVSDIMKHRVRFSPQLEALVSGEKRYTFQEYNQRANQLAHVLLEKYVQKGDRVAILCKNSHLFPTIVLAILKAGAIAVPLNWRLNPGELDYILRDCQPKVLFYDEEYESTLSFVREAGLFFTAILAGSGVDSHPSFEALLLNSSVMEPDVPIDPEDPATIIYTSGTTGNPKGVVSCHRNWFYSVVSTTNALDWCEGDRYLAASPIFHASGMIVIFSSILRGMTMVLMADFDPAKILDTLERERINSMVAVPTMLIYLLPEVMKTERDLSSLKFFISGASKVPEKLIEQYHSFGYSVVQAYGCTEASTIITYWKPRMGWDTVRSVGKPVLEAEIKIVDPETEQELPAGEVGEIVFRGPHVFQGYWKNPEATEQTLRNGWLFTGDAGKLDEDGFLYVIDRYKDLIICGGTNIYPAQVEPVIQELEGVQEVALIGIPDKVWGELAVAYIVKRPGSNLTEDQVIDYCKQKLANYKVAGVVFVEDLPKNSMGKVLKRVLRQQAIDALEDNDE